ncbi:aldehyde dehydrogenase [Risungbinella massiliensis]|uniref:aldehyde dehydrogenase n=1 Tax=Risungbinella massiliensis TaxID=1329796 RepID=UPI0005CC176B|nr:aldehyde dehydrogenase [Risungbinella massiliensis]
MMKIAELLQNQRTFFHTGKTKDLAFRLENLAKLKEAIKRYEPDILNALQKDLARHETDAYLTEIGILYEEIKFAQKHLKKWAKPKSVKSGKLVFGAKSEIRYEPYGVGLIIAPWNYPFQLLISPLIGAMAAGNCAILKPSELSPHVSKVVYQMIEGIFPKEYITVVEGGVEISQELLKQPFDHIFYTGGEKVGKMVMKAAAKHLTPVVLELGGKSPTIVDKDADLDLAAKRILWGKFINAGQTCIAPDYVMVQEEVKEVFVRKLQHYLLEFYGEDPLENVRLGKIVNDRHFERLQGYLDEGVILYGGQSDPDSRKIAPTLLDGITWDNSVMKEEIFGPILPILPFVHLKEVIEQVTNQPKPLACYFFSTDNSKQELIVDTISCGGMTINDCVVHISNPNLPFGGVGASGMGSYHGEHGFHCFSHAKSVVYQTNRFDFSFRYPNYKNAARIIRAIFK